MSRLSLPSTPGVGCLIQRRGWQRKCVCLTASLPNIVWARQRCGVMVLRIEDTDVDGSEDRFEDQVIADLNWLGLDWDEGPDVGGAFAPYRQSDRLAIYREHAERLLSEHKAYLCFCGEEDLQRERERAAAEHRQPIYSGKCRPIDPEQAQRRRAAAAACANSFRSYQPRPPL